MVASCRSLAPQAKTQPFVAVDILCWALHMLLSLLLSRSHWRRRLPTCGSVLCMSGFEQQQVIQHTSFPRPVKSDNRLGRFRLPSVGTPRRCTDGAEPVRCLLPSPHNPSLQSQRFRQLWFLKDTSFVSTCHRTLQKQKSPTERVHNAQTPELK